MSVNEKQVGGDHYKSEYQHWDWVEDIGLQYLEACATKYVARYKKKNGAEDLKKARHYIEKCIDTIDKRQAPCLWLKHRSQLIGKFLDANKLTGNQRDIIWAIADWRNIEDLDRVLFGIDYLLSKEDLGFKEERDEWRGF